MGAKPRPPVILIDAWLTMLAEEYHVDESDAGSWLYNKITRPFVVEFLQSKGWKVEEYTAPPVSGGKVISEGYVISDDCEQFVAWRLSQGDAP